MAMMMTLERRMRQVQQRIKDYQEEHGLKLSSTAYLEKHGNKEPGELLQERRDIFRELVDIIHDARERGWEKEQIREALDRLDVPKDYRMRAERAAEKQEQVLERQRTMTAERRTEIQEEIQGKLESHKDLIGDFAFLLEQNEKMIQEDKLRSLLEYGRHQGLTDAELISIAVQTGVEHDHAEHLVENTLQDDVDRQFYIDEANRQEEYTEEYEAIYHH